jgi:hypothetical protein
MEHLFDRPQLLRHALLIASLIPKKRFLPEFTLSLAEGVEMTLLTFVVPPEADLSLGGLWGDRGAEPAVLGKSRLVTPSRPVKFTSTLPRFAISSIPG